ncbi:MAG: hypothetical protein JKX70_05370 [Phycisphaerales bacterium]|nr:hypothetical protein [Phycisphaerales bacterium]
MIETALGNNEQRARVGVMEQAKAVAGQAPVPALRSLVCPYCGVVTSDTGRCKACSGRFDPLSRQATQNQMGAWSIRDDRLPFRPGCTYETIAKLIEQHKITPETILRGPSTRQFWTLARNTPGVAHLLGMCHSCQVVVETSAFACPSCHASFTIERDRQHLGLGPSRPLPGQGLPEVLAMRAEPAAGAINAAVVSTPIAIESSSMAQPRQAGLQGGDALGRQQAEEASKLARRWKVAYELERRRAWIVMGISVVLTVIAMTYALLGVMGDVRGGAEGGSEQVSALADE